MLAKLIMEFSKNKCPNTSFLITLSNRSFSIFSVLRSGMLLNKSLEYDSIRVCNVGACSNVDLTFSLSILFTSVLLHFKHSIAQTTYSSSLENLLLHSEQHGTTGMFSG